MFTRFLTVLVYAALFFASPHCVLGDQPNIIYILLDDAGYGDLGCYGQKQFVTPNIDKLAEQGMRFTQHYSGSTVCASTRSSLMTGLHTGHTYIRGNKAMQPEGQHPLPASTVTLAKLLTKAGYRCGGFGKWGLGGPGSEGEPTRQGFETFYGYNCQREAHNYYPGHLWHNTEKIELDKKTYAHDLIMDQTLKFIRDSQKGPFFCFVPVTIPHASMHVPKKYSDPFRKTFPQFENKIGKYSGPEVINPIAAFAGMMTKMDEDVGRIMNLLKELGIDDETLVMISSDNGPHKEGGHDPEFFDSNGPFRGFKRDLYEGGIRVPLIARWPGKVDAGQTSDLVSAQWDLLPTFCELAKSAEKIQTDGISIVPTLLGIQSQKKHDYLYWEFYEQGGKRAARFGDWKAVQKNVHKDLDSPIEIFDLAKDKAEAKNIADLNPAAVSRAKEIFADAHTPSEIWKFRSAK